MCAPEGQHRKAAPWKKQPSSAPLTSVTSPVSDQTPSVGLEAFQISANLCKFSVCLFLSLWCLAIFSSSYSKLILLCKGHLEKQKKKKKKDFLSKKKNEYRHLAGGKLQNSNYYVNGTHRRT